MVCDQQGKENEETLKMMFLNIFFFSGLELQHHCRQTFQTTLSDKQQWGQLHSDQNSLEG